MKHWIIAALLGVLLLAPFRPCLAEEDLPSYLRLRDDNKIYRGEITSLSETEVTIKDESGALITFELKNVRPRDVFNLRRARVADDDEAGLVDLAGYAIEEGLLDAAQKTLDTANALRGDLADVIAQKLRDLRTLQAKEKLGRAVRINEASAGTTNLDDFTRAREICREVMDKFSDTEYAHQARVYLDEVLENERIAQETIKEEQKLAAQREAQLAAAKVTDRLNAYMREVESHVIAAKDLRDKGLSSEANGSVSAAVYAYEDAAKHYLVSLEILDKRFFSERGLSLDFLKQAEKARKVIQRALKNCYIEWTSTYVSVPNWREARKKILLALEIDPEDESALEYFNLINENYIERSVRHMSGLPK